MTQEPLLKVRGLVKRARSGAEEVTILHGLDFDIYAGEMIAVIGQSGSGKSTLMNILGCLDRPSDGAYWIDGINTAQLDRRERARLRREQIGFIFQRYHLLNDLNARENVCLGAVYAGMPAEKRRNRADSLLTRLGLDERKNHKPSQLSGGEQQRVSIARALMNGGRIIFADEPTGALDSASGKEVMAILGELNAAGHTIILVTHDPQIAAAAERVIELKDGMIVADTVRKPGLAKPCRETGTQRQSTNAGFTPIVQMAIRAILGHKLRAFLTMLGITIGIASVVSMVALGQGSQQKVLARISYLVPNSIQVFRGRFGEHRAGSSRNLSAADAQILSRQSFIDAATPVVYWNNNQARIANRTLSARAIGIGVQYSQTQNLPLVKGRAFTAADIERHETVAFLDHNGAERLFGKADPLGQVLLVENVPVTIIGVVDSEKAGFERENTLNIWLPYTTVMSRLIGRDFVHKIILRVVDNVDSKTVEAAVRRILTRRHGSLDFTLFNNDAHRSTITETTRTLSLLITAIAVIALVVGGVGVMNIMLVSVTERTREIGIRIAIGARQSDIMRQFLSEAVLLCLIGGVIGVALAYGFGWLVAISGSDFVMIYSIPSIVIAFICATVIGILFGYLPARNAARLDPVKALASE